MTPAPAVPVEPPPAEAPAPPRRGRGLLAIILVVGLLAGALTLLRGAVATPEPDPGMAGMAGMGAMADADPIALDSLRPDVAELYRHADEHAELYRDVPCYCGCDRFADHRHLYDCFVRTDGAGFEAHGAGCAICQAEAVHVRQLLRRGLATAQIREAIIEKFGPATNPARA